MSVNESPFGASSRSTTRKHREDAVLDDASPDNGRERAEAGRNEKARDVQPGTGKDGKSWQSRSPDPHDDDDKLNQALKDSFPASDPPQPAQPGITGWDLKDEEKKKQAKSAG